MKRNIITICGVLGSGKSTTAKRVASTLGYAHYSGGDFMRAMATERGITLAELNILAETDPAIDKEIDRKQKEFMDANENFVIDSRLGWFWAPDSFKVFLNLPVSVSAQRVFADMQAKKSERANEVQKSPETFEEVEARLAERFASEGERYKKYYDIDNYQDSKHFDLVIDTSINDIPAVERLVIEGYKKWQAEKTEK
ncbi:MAG: cytidylate kinase family protein [Candidatus Pacebacteria bacterium]|nr:cytidylate kinase family protein [Candidatus Paceibacterota bacterium]